MRLSQQMKEWVTGISSWLDMQVLAGTACVSIITAIAVCCASLDGEHSIGPKLLCSTRSL
jgi:hypothetical protein